MTRINLTAPLTDSQVHEIRMARGSKSMASVAKKFGRTIGSIQGVQKGWTHKHVPFTDEERRLADMSLMPGGRYHDTSDAGAVLVLIENALSVASSTSDAELEALAPALTIMRDAVAALKDEGALS